MEELTLMKKSQVFEHPIKVERKRTFTKNNIQVCLINPSLDKKTTSKFPMSGVPLGIASLAAYLHDKHVPVEAIDAVVLKIDQLETAKKAVATGAKVIGISCLTENRYSAIETLKHVKELNPDVMTVIGGLHPTFSHQFMAKEYPFIDVVVRGEGEVTLMDLLRVSHGTKTLEEVQGITYMKNGEVKVNPNRPFLPEIETLPIPAYELFPLYDYSLPPDVNSDVKQTSQITTSRGCPMGCNFCETTEAWGRGIRSTSAERLYEHVRYLNDNFGINYIRFADDLFTIKKDKVKKFCRMVIEDGLKIGFRLQARVDTVDPEMLSLLKQAGCDLIEYGAESGSDKVLREVGKGTTVERIHRAARMTKEAGIELKYFLMVGSLNEGPMDTWGTFQLIKDTRPDFIGVNALTIYPGTGVYDAAKKEGLVNDEHWRSYVNPKTGNAPLYAKNYSEKEMIFLAQLAHVWSCRNSDRREEYPFIERMLATILTENFAKLLVTNNYVRKTSANVAAIFSPLIS